MSAQPIADAAEREAALDPSRSCIVQAPAGSGKTGLLIQRYLRLLATVERPEEILAITFTRKAAAEMRRRVLQALAAAGAATEPVEPNARRTHHLARAALERDRACGWRLLDNAARLRIQTIDSLCAALARQMPLLSGLGAPPAIVDDARVLYREAAERTLGRIESDEPVAAAVRRFLVHLDGDWAAARGLLEAMLARRDQWIRRVVGFEADATARAALERAFARERERTMRRLRALLPDHEESELVKLAVYAAGNVAKDKPDSPIARLAALTRYPAAVEEGVDHWCALAELLLVASGAWRSSVDKRIGFPPGARGPDALFKEQMRALLERLRPVEGLCEALHAVRCMPPAGFTDAQWDVLGAMVALLPRAAAELQVVFAERGEIDFPGLAQAAVTALGEPEAPTDLLLALDVRLRHLLVDEFQDTSHAQWELLTRLTAGWSEGDGRTVFLVGDPMQSIYRFREADVALFLRARERGLPSVALASVRLATNFRSRAGIVTWVNGAFAQILCGTEDPDSGAVPYSPSGAHHPGEPAPAVQWHPFVGRDASVARDAEARTVARLAAGALAEGAQATAAILVRNRSHLDRIVPALKAAGVRFRAVDIEPLAARPVIQDLLAVARALAHLGDRVAWLALLRAPWCALTVAELHALAAQREAVGGEATVWELLHDAARVNALPGAVRQRVLRVRDALAPFVAHRLRGSLRERVEGAWLALGGPAGAREASDLEDAETFFDQLDALEEGGDLPDPALLEEHLAELFAAPDTGGEARLQLMTIHKAKGLEFDTVIVPGLDRLPRAGDRPLFAWKARADGTLMMAPVRAAGEAAEPAYDYLRALDEAAAEHELERLLYVAATRAARRLHLSGYARTEEKAGLVMLRKPASRSLLGKAWSVARDPFEAALPLALAAGAQAPPSERPADALRVLDESVFAAAVPEPAGAAVPRTQDTAPLEFSWVGETARHVGIVTHRWLQRIAADGAEHWSAERVHALQPAIARELARRGVPPGEREIAAQRVVEALAGTLADERGRWVLRSHADARSEYRVRLAGPDGVRVVVMDRVFRDAAGQRWVVDYKTSMHEGGEPERFLDRELERYAPQLTRYATAFPGEAPALALYFPLMKGWRRLPS